MSERTVVITGVGIITSLGTGLDGLFQALLEGRSGIGPITRFDASTLATRIGGEVQDDLLAPLPIRLQGREISPGSDIKAVLAWNALNQIRPLISAGACLFCAVGLEKIDLNALREGRRERWQICPEIPPALLGEFLWRELGFRGSVSTQVTACAAGTIAIGSAFRAVREGRCDCAVAGGVDSLIFPYGIHTFNSLGALSERNDLGARALAPFDRHRTGTLLGEGAAFMVLEEKSRALGRGVPIWAIIQGYGAAMDATHPVIPDASGSGLRRAMIAALRDAQLSSDAIEYVNAHGTGTRQNDAMECLAMREVFGERMPLLPVSSTKPFFGHLLSAAGAVETATCLLPFARKALPPTLHFSAPDPDCPIDCIPCQARPAHPHYVMKNSAGLGGQNASLILARSEVE
ncbi:hypothetical protein AUK22_02880 [bacterium CG2_30_54_10]|nr:MAG: hypothetical protein AUK22_02880 [bacterium CG2_30_54_10]